MTVYLLCAGVAFLLRTGTPPASANGYKLAVATPLSATPKPGEGGRGVKQRSAAVGGYNLTFSERVAYQYAIEEVYWRHRIWPKDNPGPKPSLDQVLSPEHIQRKVEDYVRRSQLLKERQQAITPEQIRTEMDRMAHDTKQADVLRELFTALGNDPFVIAECLARPVLAERLVRERTMHDSVDSFVSNAWALPVASAPTSQSYTLPEISVPLDCADNTWIATATVTAPDAREGHTAVWTGSEMIVWGGKRSGSQYFNTGARYNPATDNWAAMTIANAPPGRSRHTGVWTGSEMIVWGGFGCGANCNFNSGGRYNPATDSWTATTTENAPVARWDHKAMWTGSEMIIWGGTDDTNYLHTGGRYIPAIDRWTPTGLVNVPLGRVAHTAVWTGSEMIVWGGRDETFDITNTGGRYNPGNDSWVATSLTSAPSSRGAHTGVWTGSEMVVWAGNDTIGFFNTGGRYNPATDSWRATTTANAPSARGDSTAVWTGSQMIVWGGIDLNGQLNTGGSYCAQPSAPIVQGAVSRKIHANAGSFDVNLPLSETPGIECRSGGATGDYTIVVTFLANVSLNGNPQAAVTSGIGTIGSGGVSDGGRVTIAGNVVTIPLTNVANAQTINVTLNNVNGSTNVVIPMRVLIGDTSGNGRVNSSDISQIKTRLGQVPDASNFRSDLNADGNINATDVSLVKSAVGTGLP